MSKETKFGYGFLLVGAGLPYLMDKFLGPVSAVIVAVAGTAIGIGLLILAHLPEKKEERERIGKNLGMVSNIVMLLLLSGALITAIITIRRVLPPARSDTNVSDATTNNASPQSVSQTEDDKPLGDGGHSEPEVLHTEIGIATGDKGFEDRGSEDVFKECGTSAVCFDEEKVKGKTLLLPLHDKRRVAIAVLVKIYAKAGSDVTDISYPHVEVVTSAPGVALNDQGATRNPSHKNMECSAITWWLTSMEHFPYGCIVDLTVPTGIDTVPLKITVSGRNMKPHTVQTKFALEP